MIKFENLSVGFNNRTILRDLNGSLKKGELIALMGVNGVGKSCFLRTLCGLQEIIKGELSIDHVSYELLNELEIARKLAIVLTDKVQVDFLTVHEFISTGRSPYTNLWGKLTQSDCELIDDMISLLGLDEVKQAYFSDLSDGQKQKVQLTRALVQTPEFLVLDEPTTYLDIPSKVDLIKIMRSISRDKNIGILFSTHDLSLITSSVDQVWLIDKGGVLHKKSPEEMNHSGLLESNFNL